MGMFDDLVPDTQNVATLEPPSTGGLFDDLVPQAGIAQPHAASGALEAIQAGYQSSATGLMIRNRLPDVVLDPTHAKWYEKALANAGQMVSELPEMAAGAVAGGIVGSALPGPGTAIGAGAGAFAVPTAIRESYMQALSKGQVTSSADFLNRASIVLKETGKSALVGGLTAGAGMLAGRAVGGAIAGDIGTALSVPQATARIGAAQLGAEYGTMVVAPAALEGKLPEPEDFFNAGVVLGGFKAAGHVAVKLRDIYSQAGVAPEQVVSDAFRDPKLKADLAEEPKDTEPPTFAERMAAKAKQEQELGERLSNMTGEEVEAEYQAIKTHNDGVERDAVERYLGPDRLVEYDALGSRRAKDKWLDANITDAAQDFMNDNMRPESFAENYRGAAGAFNETSPQALGESIAVLSKDVDKPNFMASPAGATFKAALRYAQEQGWDMNEVLGAMRARAVHWAGDDAPELFARLFRDAQSGRDKLLAAPPENLAEPIVRQQARGGREIPDAYRPLADADVVRNSVPDPMTDEAHALDVAATMSHLKGDVPLGKQPNYLNFDYVETPDQLKQVSARISEIFQTQIEQARGEKSWDESMDEARAHLADIAGLQPTDLPTGTPSQDALVMAKAAMNQKGLADVWEASNAPDAGTQEGAMRIVAAIQRSVALQADSQGNLAEVARALNAAKAGKQVARLTEGLGALVDKFGNDPQKLADMVKELQQPEQLAKFAREVVKANTYDKVIEAWKAGILSGPVTHMANIMGNTIFATIRAPIDAVAAGIGRLRGAEAGDRVAAMEPIGRIAGFLQGTSNGLKVGAAILKTGADPMGKGEQQPGGAIGGKIGEVIRTPFRLLSAEDAVSKAQNEGAEAMTLAMRQADKEGINPLTREYRERLATLMNNPTPEMAAQIEEAGKRFTFNTNLGEMGRSVQNLVREWKLQWLVPFIRTPANIAKELLRMTPIAPVIGEWRAAIKEGGVARDKAIAELTFGSGVMAVVMGGAFNGTISGAGSPDPNKRRVQLASGWQPYSIKIGKTWYSYNRLQPVGTLMGMAADLAEVWDHVTEDESDKVPKMLATAFANAITNQTFLQGITTLVNAMSDPTRFAPRMLQSYAGSVVPALVAQAAQMNDPFEREIDSMLDAIKSRIPIERQTLLPKRDAFGEAIAAKERLGGVAPITESQVSDDKVRQEAARLDISVAAAPKKTHLGAGTGKIGDVELTPEQKDVFAETGGKLAHQILTSIVNTPGWDDLPDLIQQRVFQKVFVRAHRIAALKALTPAERAAHISDITEKMAAELAPAE